MKYWKCTVCGYIHEGPEPPDECPVCGAPRDKFDELAGDEGRKEYEAYMDRMGDKIKEIIAKKEQEGLSPPSGEPAKEAESGGSSGLLDFVFSQMAKHHAHPISVHTPNGVLPLAVLFLVLSVFTRVACMNEASFYCLVFVVIFMPGVLFSGYVDWQVRFGGQMTRVIMTKIICGIAVLVIGGVLVIWYLISPDVTTQASAARWTYLLVHFLMLAFAGYAGYLGGTLVFKD